MPQPKESSRTAARRRRHAGDDVTKDEGVQTNNIKESKTQTKPKTDNNSKKSIVNARSVVPPRVAKTLALFSILLFVVPLGGYYVLRDMVFAGNTTLSALGAAVLANIVVGAFVVVAFLEPDDDDDNANRDLASKTK